MKKVKIIAGICWAVTGLFVIIFLFFNINGLSVSLSRLPFMKLNPRYTGGEVVSHVTNGNCTMDIRRPVFNGLLRERKTGFVQIDWRGEVPEVINDSIDFNGDGKKDFYILADRKTSKTNLKSFNPQVKDVVVSTRTSYGWSVRVGLVKE